MSTFRFVKSKASFQILNVLFVLNNYYIYISSLKNYLSQYTCTHKYKYVWAAMYFLFLAFCSLFTFFNIVLSPSVIKALPCSSYFFQRLWNMSEPMFGYLYLLVVCFIFSMLCIILVLHKLAISFPLYIYMDPAHFLQLRHLCCVGCARMYQATTISWSTKLSFHSPIDTYCF